MIKKIVVLASMALALVAMAAPAAQANPEWTNPGGYEIAGGITSERGGLATGPGEVDLTGTLEGSGGSITAGEITGTVPTNIPGCHAKGTVGNLPWPVSLTTPDTIDIGGHVEGPSGPENRTVTFMNHYTTASGPGCFGIVPPTVPVEGTVTGTVENQGDNEVCINLNTKLDDLHVEGSDPSEETVDLTGIVCIEGTEVE